MPTVVLFDDGVAKDKIIGFEGLAELMPEGKEDEWSTADLARLIGSKGFIKMELIIDTEADKAKKAIQIQESKNKIMRSMLTDLDDLDFSLDDN
jgi:CheY-specific phosphatase CheX